MAMCCFVAVRVMCCISNSDTDLPDVHGHPAKRKRGVELEELVQQVL